HFLLLYMIRPPRLSTLFPYTTLFRSRHRAHPARYGRRRSPPESRSSQTAPPSPPPPAGPRRSAAATRCRRCAAWRSATGCQRPRSEEHTSELQSRENLVCRLLLEKKK